LRAALLWLISLYQRVVSPMRGAPACRYLPTCSQYAADAIASRGVVVGVAKGMWRILRCNPFGGSGYDPVEPPAPASDAADRKY